jgi:prepilin-type N-terminal cleavage/methylation domain-containing protein
VLDQVKRDSPTCHRAAPRWRHRGLTIIELMTVLIVLGVLITLSVAPSVRGMAARQRVQGVHTGVMTDLQLARSKLEQRSETVTSVAVSFGTNADMTCYTIHAMPVVACDCTSALADKCNPVEAEIKSVQLARSAGVTVAATSASGPRVEFKPPHGLAAPADLVIDVQDNTSGQLRTSLTGLGVPRVCSPDGSIRGVPTC